MNKLSSMVSEKPRGARLLTASLRDHLSEPLHRTASGIMASTAVTAVLGFGFWIVATRTLSASDVGRDSALIATMMTISSICLLNMNNVIPRFLPQVKHSLSRRVVDAYSLSAVLSIFGATLFVWLAPKASSEFDFLAEDTLLSIGFCVATGIWSIFILQDAVLTALSRAMWMPAENGVFGVLKIILLPIIAGLAFKNVAFLSWVVPALVILPVVNWLIFTRVVPAAAQLQAEASGVVDVFGWRALFKFLAQDLAGTVVGQVSLTAMPLLVVAILGQAENAYFYVPFLIASSFDLMYLAVSTSLTTEGARATDRIAEVTNHATRRLLRFQLPGALLILIAAPLLLLPFGPDYVEHGTSVLRILALASMIRPVLFLYGAAGRLEGHGTRLLVVQIVTSCALVALVLLLAPSHGLDGVAVAWLAAHSLGVLVIAYWLISFLRDPNVATSESPA